MSEFSDEVEKNFEAFMLEAGGEVVECEFKNGAINFAIVKTESPFREYLEKLREHVEKNSYFFAGEVRDDKAVTTSLPQSAGTGIIIGGHGSTAAGAIAHAMSMNMRSFITFDMPDDLDDISDEVKQRVRESILKTMKEHEEKTAREILCGPEKPATYDDLRKEWVAEFGEDLVRQIEAEHRAFEKMVARAGLQRPIIPALGASVSIPLKETLSETAKPALGGERIPFGSVGMSWSEQEESERLERVINRSQQKRIERQQRVAARMQKGKAPKF